MLLPNFKEKLDVQYKNWHTKPLHFGVGVYTIYSLIKNMSKDMTGKEKLLFIASFVWAMHWGVRLSSVVIGNIL